jgi:hypothetical protein
MAKRKSSGNLQANLTAVETVVGPTRNQVGGDVCSIPGRGDKQMGIDRVTFHGAGTGRPKVA